MDLTALNDIYSFRKKLTVLILLFDTINFSLFIGTIFILLIQTPHTQKKSIVAK